MDSDDIPFLMISDKEELLFLLKGNGNKTFEGKRGKVKTMALWTNYEVLTRTLYKLFSELWNAKAKEKIKVKAK